METRTALEASLKEALRSGDDLRKRTIRQALAAIKQVEIDRRAAPDETAVVGIIQKEIKTRRESLEEARKAGRAGMAVVVGRSGSHVAATIRRTDATWTTPHALDTGLAATSADAPERRSAPSHGLISRVGFDKIRHLKASSR